MKNAHWFSWWWICWCQGGGWSMTRYFYQGLTAAVTPWKMLIIPFYQNLTAAVMMITAASPHSIELTHIHLTRIYLIFSSSQLSRIIWSLGHLLLLLTVALAETMPLLSVSMSSLSSIVLPVTTSLLQIRLWASFGRAVVTQPDQLTSLVTRARTVWWTSYLIAPLKPIYLDISAYLPLGRTSTVLYLHFEPLSQFCLLLISFYSGFLMPSRDLSQKVSTGT